MTTADIKLYAINSGAMAISMTHIDMILKITLLVVTIGYTVHKWMKLKDEK